MMNDDQKIALAIVATFLAGWLPAASYGHPQAGLAWGSAAVLLQIIMAFAFDDEEY